MSWKEELAAETDMASMSNLRSRRNAAQLHALAEVEREIHAKDSQGRRKYLREFNRSFQTYQSVLTIEDVQTTLRSADIVLIGDYHALPTSQRSAASLLEQRALAGDRPVVLGLETIFARDQHILDEWWRREIDETELRQRIRFDLDWGYDWAPFYELLVSARDNAEALYGLDCMPREDLRKIGARDRHAALKIAEIRQKHPNAVVFVLFGESHMAPAHLPRAVRKANPEARVMTVLQNVDSLYWRAAGEQADKVEAVRVTEDVLCVFNATPLEKYESYRLFLDQWSRSDDSPDYAPTIYNLIDSLASFLEINRHSPHNGTQPKFLVDMLPEVYGGSQAATLGRLLLRKGASEEELQKMLARVEECGSTYLSKVNAFYVREFQMMHAAEDATRFLHQACQGLPQRLNGHSATDSVASEQHAPDRFYARVIEHAIAYFGSRVLYPSRPAPQAENASPSRAAIDKIAQAAARSGNGTFESTVLELGQKIGSQIYDAYLAGKVAPSGLRRLFLAHLDEPGLARKVCGAVISKLKSISRPLMRAAHA
jgi:hypothetical protein